MFPRQHSGTFYFFRGMVWCEDLNYFPMNDQTTNSAVSTDEIMQYLKEFMVVKEDLVNFATKEDLERFATKEDLEQVKNELRSEFKEDISKLRSDFMDYLDRRLLDLKGDIIVIMKSENRMICDLVALLVSKSLISTNEAHSIIKMQPFPQSV